MVTSHGLPSSLPERISADSVGIIFPTRREHLSLLQSREKPVFVKFITHAGSKNATKLKPGDILFFYVSREEKKISHWAAITAVSFGKPDEVMRRFGHSVQMGKEDFLMYSRERMTKPLLILELDQITRLMYEQDSPYPITMVGKNISSEETRRLIEAGDPSTGKNRTVS